MDAGIGVGGLSLAKDEVSSSKFDVFSPIEYETSIKEVAELDIHPKSTATSMGPFTFTALADPEKWTDCESIRLHGRMRIVKKSGTDVTKLTAADNIGTVDNIFHSLWSNVRVSLNNTEITDPSGKWYAYKAFLETKLSYSSKSKETILSSRGYAQDTAGKFNDFGTPANDDKAAVKSQNEGWLTRKGWFKDGNWVSFCINLHSDITTLRNYLPPGVQLDFEFERNSDEFCLLGPKPTGHTYAIELENLHLTMKRLKPSEDIQKFWNQSIKNGEKARMAIDRSVLKKPTVSANKSDLSIYNVISGRQGPDQVVVGVLDEEAHNGAIDKNPFEFKDFDITECSIIVDGQHEPRKMYKMNKDNNDTADIWANFLENTGVQTDDREFGITKDDYFGGTFLLAWDRTPDKCNRYHRHIMPGGTIDLHLKSSKPLTKTATIIVYATYSTDLTLSGTNVEKYLF